jgi:hypothetical protein
LEAMLIRERYKVVRVLDVRENYAFLEAVDIQDREKKACFLNLYEGPLLREYLDCFDRLTDYPDFRGMFVSGETMAAVFDWCGGNPIDEVFLRGAEHDWKTRLDYAELFLNKALSLANMPPQISCAMLLSDNVRIDISGQRVLLRGHIAPLPGMNARELALLAGDQVKKILLPGVWSPAEELEFIDRLDEGLCPSVVKLYALWREYRDVIVEAYDKLSAMNPIRRWFKLLWKTVRRKTKKRKTR